MTGRCRGPWSWLAPALAVILGVGVARADVVVRKPSEDDADLVARVLGLSVEVAQKVVRSTELAGGKVTLITFVEAEGNSLVGHLLIEKSPAHYEHLSFPSCEEEGGPPELLAVFFARTAKDDRRDLAVLCRWEARGPFVNGMFYAARFYRLEERGATIVIAPVTEMNAKFRTEELVRKNEHGKWVRGPRAKFTTVAEVKKLLTKMGLKP